MKESVEKWAIKFSRHNLGHTVLPPGRRSFAMMKLHPAKLARIGKDERAFPLI